MRVDLHIHSTASDGSLSPAQVATAAHAGGLDVIALTDHDTVAGVDACIAAGAGRVHVIPGIEVSSRLDDADIHVLGYYIDIALPAIGEYARLAAQGRAQRMRTMIERLEALGVSVAFDDVVAAAGPDASNLSRPHLARALVSAGHVPSVGEAFLRYIGDAGPAYEAHALVTASQAIDLIHDAGGVAAWAHPSGERFEDTLDRLTAAGLDAIECYRPRGVASDSLMLEAAARQRGLMVTGGSDWHGVWHGELGNFAMSREDLEPFLAKGGL